MDLRQLDREFRLNQITIDPIANRVMRDGEELEVTPKVIQILQYMASRPGELITYQDLADNVWNGFVSESALYQQITQLRKVLADNPNKPAFVKTVPRQGYRLICEVSGGTEAKADGPAAAARPQARATTSRRWPTAAAILACCAALITVWQWPSAPGLDSQNTSIQTFDDQLIDPERTIALELFNRQGEATAPELQATLERITEFHLGRRTGQHVIRTPSFDEPLFYQRLNRHLEGHGSLTYIITTETSLDETGVNYQLNFHLPADMEKVGRVSTHFNRDNPAAALPEFERQLLGELRRLSLAADTDSEILGADVAANRALIDALKPWASSVLRKETVEAGIAAAEQALALQPDNLIAYSVLFNEISWLLNSFNGDFAIDRTLASLQQHADRALQVAPNDFKALHAKAAYYCWLDELDSCAEWLERALAQRPFDPRLLRTLDDYLQKTEQSTLKLAHYNYQMHPFTGGSLYYYRNVLIGQGKLSQAVKLVGNHTFRETWDGWGPVWRLEVQKQQKLDQLRQSAKWYRKHYLPLAAANPAGIDAASKLRAQVPSRYLAFNLLNANQAELARYWNANGRERNSSFFDLSSLDLLANLWQGQWDVNQWRSVRDMAVNSAGRINSFDRLRLAFFDFRAGYMNQASESLLAIYPEFADGNLQITRDNLRPAIYYAEVQKRQNNYRQAANLNAKLRQYLEQLGNNPERDLDFGIADVEFYALNSDKARALSLLKQAVEERDWLPNAYWLWLPLAQNPFLNSLKSEAEFQRLSQVVDKRLASLCFDNACRASR